MTDESCVEIVRFRPKAGAADELLELRPKIAAEVNAHYPKGASGHLYELEDGTWVDVYSWASRADAEDLLSDPSRFPSFARWLEITELISFEWATRLDAGSA